LGNEFECRCSQTSIKINDGAGIVFQTPNACPSNSVVNLKSNALNLQSFHINVNIVLYASGLHSNVNKSCNETVYTTKDLRVYRNSHITKVKD
jgi:hypothetical protein